MSIEYSLYTALSAIVALFLAAKTDRKGLAFMLLFWIFAQPVFNAWFFIPVPGMSFDLQTNRVFFLLMLAYLAIARLSNIKPTFGAPQKRPEFEKYLYIYLALVIIALVINYSYINPKTIFATPLEIVTFIVVYVVAKRYATESLIETILRGIVILSVILALIAIVQFAFEPQLLRTGSEIHIRKAFGNYLRSTAIFQGEYELGYFQNLALMVVLVRYRGTLRLYVLAPLLILSVLLTFHRMNYIIMFVCLTTYFAYFSRKRTNLTALVLILALPFVLVLSYDIYRSMSGHSKAVEERIESDTVTGRLMQFKVVANAMWDHPLGLGSYENQTYYKLMDKNRMMQWIPDGRGRTRPEPLTVHNGYLAAGIQYGIAGAVAFIALFMSMLRYFNRRIMRNVRSSVIPFYGVLIYVLLNLSNGIIVFRTYFVILLAILCGMFVTILRSNVVKTKTTPENSVGLQSERNNTRQTQPIHQ